MKCSYTLERAPRHLSRIFIETSAQIAESIPPPFAKAQATRGDDSVTWIGRVK